MKGDISFFSFILNFDFIYFHNRLYQFTNIMYAIAIFLTYNLQFYVPFTLLWPRICRRILYRYDDKKKSYFEIGFRVILILITCKLPSNLSKQIFQSTYFSYCRCIDSKSWSCYISRWCYCFISTLGHISSDL